jgi:hypothetical protein
VRLHALRSAPVHSPCPEPLPPTHPRPPAQIPNAVSWYTGEALEDEEGGMFMGEAAGGGGGGDRGGGWRGGGSTGRRAQRVI